MRALTIALMSLSLVACNQDGGQPAAASGDVTQPSITLADLESKVLNDGTDQITILSGILTDTYCGHAFPVTATSEANGIVTVEVDGWSGSNGVGSPLLKSNASFTDPGHQGCQVDVLPLSWYNSTSYSPSYFTINGTLNGQPASMDMAFRVTYEVSAVNGQISVKRYLKTRGYLRLPSTWIEAERELEPMMYELQ